MLHADVQNIADCACANHLTRLTDERIAGVRIRYAEQQTALLRNAGKLLGFLGVQCKRLVAYNVDAMLEKALCDLVMRIVCRHDGDKINTVLTRGLLVCHFAEIRIHAAGVRQVIRLSGRAVLIHAAGEAAADQLGRIVQHSAPAVELADVRTKSAADHTKFQHNSLLLTFYISKFTVSTLPEVCDAIMASAMQQAAKPSLLPGPAVGSIPRRWLIQCCSSLS